MPFQHRVNRGRQPTTTTQSLGGDLCLQQKAGDDELCHGGLLVPLTGSFTNDPEAKLLHIAVPFGIAFCYM